VGWRWVGGGYWSMMVEVSLGWRWDEWRWMGKYGELGMDEWE